MTTTDDFKGIAARINEIFNMLSDAGKVRNQTDFAAQLGMNRVTLRNYLKNENSQV